MSGPSVFVVYDIVKRAEGLIGKGTGQGCREGVELLLKNDLSISCGPNDPFPPPGASNAGALVHRGLKVLSDSPAEALGVKRGDDLATIRKAYKKMALKYHPDKSPTTAPLFQIICTAYEKLCVGAPDKSAAGPKPPKSPQKTAPPTAPRPTQPSFTSSTYGGNKPTAGGKSTRSGHAGDNDPSSGWDSFSSSSSYTRSSNAYYPFSGVPPGTTDSTSAKFQKYQQEAREREARRQREYEEAAARSAQRRAQYHPPPPQPSSHAQSGASRFDMPPPPPPASSQHPYRRASDSGSDSYYRDYSTSFGGDNTTANSQRGGSGHSDASAGGRYSSGFPTPTGLQVSAIDATTAEVQWDSPPGGSSFVVELSWAASTAPYGMWDTSPKLVSGDRVRKKNLQAGAQYKFRIRFGKEEGGRKGPFCKSVSVKLPRESPASASASASNSSTKFASRTPPPPPEPPTPSSGHTYDYSTGNGTKQQRHQQESSRATSSSGVPMGRDAPLPHPSGLRAVPLDPSTVELQWDLPKDVTTILGVEISWNLMFGADAGLEWEVSAKQVFGDIVRKKNLVPGGQYKFRIRYVRESGVRGSWCSSVLVKLPHAPAPSPPSAASPHLNEDDEVDSRDTSEYYSHYGTEGADSWRSQGKSRNHRATAGGSEQRQSTGCNTKQGHCGDSDAGSAPPPPPPPAKPEVNEEECGHQYIPPSYVNVDRSGDNSPPMPTRSSAATPPAPPPTTFDAGTGLSHSRKHTWTEDTSPQAPSNTGYMPCGVDKAAAGQRGVDGRAYSSSPVEPDHTSSPIPTQNIRKGNDGNSGASGSGGVLEEDNAMPEEEDFTGAEKIFKLHPPPLPSPTDSDSIGEEEAADKYVLSVRASPADKSVVVGYVTVKRTIFVRIRHGDWLYLQAHWGASKGSSKRGIIAGVAAESQWGWAKRSKVLEDGSPYLLLRQVCPPAKEKPGEVNSEAAAETDAYVGADEASYASSSSSLDNGDDEDDDGDDDFLFEEGGRGPVPLWYEQRDDSGYTYYYNEDTQESEWLAPEWVEEVDDDSEARYYLKLNRSDGSTLMSTWTKPKQFARLVRLEQGVEMETGSPLDGMGKGKGN